MSLAYYTYVTGERSLGCCAKLNRAKSAAASVYVVTMPDKVATMTFAAIGSGSYNLLLLLHIVAMFVALAPTLVYPLLARDIKGGSELSESIYEGITKRSMRIYGMALVVGGLLGFGLAGLSDKVYRLSDPWLVVSIVIWIAMNGVLHAMVFPAEKAMSKGDGTQAAKANIGNAIITALFLVSLVLMVYKPGA